jgi:hypothetical protein
VQRFFACVRAIMSINLRSMALASLKDFVNHMKSYAKGNDFEGDTYREGEFLLEPMLTIRRVYIQNVAHDHVSFNSKWCSL